jgi:hypothetical protein
LLVFYSWYKHMYRTESHKYVLIPHAKACALCAPAKNPLRW